MVGARNYHGWTYPLSSTILSRSNYKLGFIKSGFPSTERGLGAVTGGTLLPVVHPRPASTAMFPVLASTSEERHGAVRCGDIGLGGWTIWLHPR